jgi:potassium-dependent mechanosensitive channel
MKDRLCLVLLALVLANTALPAAETTAPAATATAKATASPTPAISPIPLPDIVAEAISAKQVLAGIDSALAAAAVKTAAFPGLSNLEHDIDTRAAETTTIIANGPSFDILDEFLGIWQGLANSTTRWNRDLTQRATELEADAARLDEMATIWNLTASAAKTKNAPSEVFDRVNQIIASIKEHQNALQTRRADILTLQSRVAAQQARIQAELNTVQQTRQGLLSRLLTKDSPALWAFGEISSSNPSDQHAVSNAAKRAKEFVIQEPGKFAIHAALILCLFLVLRWARRAVGRWVEEDPSLQRAAPLFEMPIAVSIALSMVFTPLLYPEAPRLLRAIFGIAGLIPTVILLRRLLDRRVYPILYALIVFFLLDLIRHMSVALPLVTRGLFALEMLAGACFVIWLLRSSRQTASGNNARPPLPWLGRWYGRVSLLLFVAAFAGDCLGYVSPSYLLGNGVLAGAYLALIGYAAVRMLEGLVVIALQVRPLTYIAMVRKHRGMIHRRIMRVIQCLMFLLWLSLVLKHFQLRDPLFEGISAVLNAGLALGAFRLTLGQIIAFIVVVWLSFIVSKFLRFLLEEDVYDRVKLSRGLPYAISTVLHYTVLLFGFFIALAALGVDMTKFTILAGAFSVGVGFGLQNIINNFVSGLILLFERPIKVGDVVQVGSAAGSVQKIGIRASVIRTPDGSDVIIPNGELISTQVTNWTFSDRQRAIVIEINVPRNVDQNQLAELLLQAADETPGVAKTPAPQAFVITMTSTTLTFELRTWTDRFEDWMTVRGYLWVAINQKLARENVALA